MEAGSLTAPYATLVGDISEGMTMSDSERMSAEELQHIKERAEQLRHQERAGLPPLWSVMLQELRHIDRLVAEVERLRAEGDESISPRLLPFERRAMRTMDDEATSEPDWHIDGLPDALVKACSDPFDYAMGLRSGQVIRFFQAALSPDKQWVHLEWHVNVSDEVMHGVPYSFERGLDVRVSDIMWVADAPNGS
jgi:hypothetical protein